MAEADTIAAVKHKVSRRHHSYQDNRCPHKISFGTDQNHYDT